MFSWAKQNKMEFLYLHLYIYIHEIQFFEAKAYTFNFVCQIKNILFIPLGIYCFDHIEKKSFGNEHFFFKWVWSVNATLFNIMWLCARPGTNLGSNVDVAGIARHDAHWTNHKYLFIIHTGCIILKCMKLNGSEG